MYQAAWRLLRTGIRLCAGAIGRNLVSEPNWEQIPNRKVRDQARYIYDEFGRKGVAAKLGEPDDVNKEGGIDVGVTPFADGVGFMYAHGEILVQEHYLEKVLEILDQPKVRLPDIRDAPKGSATVEPLIDGIVVLLLPQQKDGSRIPVLEALDRIDRTIGPRHATPNHVITAADGDVGPCPATEPEQVYDGIEPFPAVAHGNGGSGISVFVGDTGLLAYSDEEIKDYGPAARPRRVVTNDGTVHAWLKGVQGTLDKLEDLSGNKIKPYEGHGTFVAGVARCMAPAADIFVANIFKVAGSTLESHLVRHLDAELAHGYDIFHLSIEAPTRKDLPLIAFERWLRRLHEYKGVACVVSAGNSGYSLPSWPAAFPEVVSVGALAADWRSRALFSNYGPWVDVYAPGRDLVNAFANGRYTCYTAPYAPQKRTFYGMAKWSGTSFSTPVVTGLIAARMSRTGENGREAAAALLAEARAHAIPGVGPVLLPY
jgi:subtilisin family serine protease